MSEPPAPASMPPRAIQPTMRRYRRPASWLERILTATFLVGLVLFFLNYLAGGLGGAGYAWFQVQRDALNFATWRTQTYVWVLVPVLGVVAGILRYALPVIEIPLLGGGESKWIRRWYIPGTLRIQDGEMTWREGRLQAYVNKSFIAPRGLLAYAITVPVERNVNQADGEVLYDTADIPAYKSRTLNRRLQQEVQERVVQSLKSREGLKE